MPSGSAALVPPAAAPVATAVETWAWVVLDEGAAGASGVEALFTHERAARAYIDCQPRGSGPFRAEVHLLHDEAPAPLYGLLARGARFVDGLRERRS